MHAPLGSLSEATKGFPRAVKLLSLEDFDAHPHRALIAAAAGDFGTLIYTAGRCPGDDKLNRHAGVAVIVPVAEYRRLTLKTDETIQDDPST